jgi:hypothetical protein
MLFVRRILTTVVLLVVLKIFFVFAGLVVLGGIAGAKAAADQPQQAHDFQSGFQTGVVVGQRMREQYLPTIQLYSWLGAGVLSIVLPFSGAFPWCRPK